MLPDEADAYYLPFLLHQSHMLDIAHDSVMTELSAACSHASASCLRACNVSFMQEW